jgi:hypothetical protein
MTKKDFYEVLEDIDELYVKIVISDTMSDNKIKVTNEIKEEL